MSLTTASSHYQVICFGEVLWDLLPTGKIAGGAPMNVAFHANNLGLKAGMISRVGKDAHGSELLAFFHEKGIPTGLIQQDEELPTGIVNVSLDERGSPSYEIVAPASWDNIQPAEAARQAVQQAGVLVFGSLACRSPRTRDTLLDLLVLARQRVFDVNLRAPFYSQELLKALMDSASLVKMNDEELEIIAAWHGIKGDAADQLISLADLYELDGLIVTRGARGAVFYDQVSLYEHPGFPVAVKDTIGSGDSFLAAFLMKFLADAPAEDCLAFACATGGLVASRPGGTPMINEADVLGLMG
jgi:fructokinase